MFQTEVVEKIKTYILCAIIFSGKLCRSGDNVENYSTVRQGIDDSRVWQSTLHAG
jgi:hypothetical protein